MQVIVESQKHATEVIILVGFAVGLAACGSGNVQTSTSTTTSPVTTTAPSTTVASQTTTTSEAAAEPVYAGEVRVTESECSFEQSGEPLTAGEVAFTVMNETEGQAGVHVWGPIADGYTFDDFAAFVEEEIRLTMAGEPFIGAPDWFGPLIPGNPEAELLEAGDAGDIAGTALPGTFGIVCARTFEELGLRVHAFAGPFEVAEGD